MGPEPERKTDPAYQMQPNSYRYQEHCPPPWLIEVLWYIDVMLLANPETGAIIRLTRKKIEEAPSVREAISKAIAKHEREREEATKPWDGSRKLDL